MELNCSHQQQKFLKKQNKTTQIKLKQTKSIKQENHSSKTEIKVKIAKHTIKTQITNNKQYK